MSPLDLGHTIKHSTNAQSYAYARVPAQDSPIHTKAHNAKHKMRNRWGFRNGRMGQQPAPDSLGAVGETPPCVTLSKEGDNLINPKVDDGPWPRSQNCTADTSPSNDLDNLDDIVSSLAQSAPIETVSSSDSDYLGLVRRHPVSPRPRRVMTRLNPS